ncbi:hybrid sensor histidine kinase/response regulator [Massilia eurypsychrophila]|uniref:histidine kinase n=1 Tax=Massilia eurypsychrophila TaxID=1485217 RepID=A0A2G8T7B0_9BURK|nr:ATP-binding protein [Massilia eurypsychrophila]PIL41940.1 hybrid sensor histidine kinase/response regulator [Massilia eurypsychrophila]
MNPPTLIPPVDTQEDLPTLIEQLHETVRRLEILTGGEVDSVADHEGRPFLLRRAQEQLRRNEAAKQAAILNALPERIALLNVHGQIITVNDAWRQFAETNALQDEDHGVGVDYFLLCARIHEKEAFTAQRTVLGIKSVLAGNVKKFALEFAYHSAIEQRWFLMTVTPLADDHAEGAIVMYKNITERKKAEQVLCESAEAMVNLDHRKDEFLAMLGHELRNPLAPIANAVQLMRLHKGDDPVQQQARDIIERQVGQLTRLVDDLLEISRINTGKIQIAKEWIVVSSIIERAVETAHPLIAQRRHELSVSQPPRPVWLHADAARLEQVVVNLLTNAAKYTEEGGHIWLSVQQEDDVLILRVRDTGVGIASELLPHVFDLFTQAERSLDRSQGGLGIGLCLVKRLVELHEGTVEVHSIIGQETEFVVRLPAMLPFTPPSQLPIAAISPSSEARRRVLVVDDNVDSAETLAMLLEASGHEVQTAYNGQGGLEAALEYQPDMMLLDIGLPELNGYEVARRIRQHPLLKHMMLVAMTGYGQEKDRQYSREAGFDHHLVKPANFDEVLRILTTV